MKQHYQCPHCQSHLRVRENIILSFKSEDSNKKGLILLNPELGNYGFIAHPSLSFIQNEKVTFLCPVCFHDLTADHIDENLATITMKDEDGKDYDIYFSRITGEHITFKIENNTIIERFGKDASSYMQFFSAKLKQQMHKHKDI